MHQPRGSRAVRRARRRDGRSCRLIHLPVETIGTRFGEHRRGDAASAAARTCRWRDADGARRRRRSPSRCSARVESLLSAVVADGMIGGRHRSNMELVAQGVANIVSPLFGGIPATGAIARTATNVKNGGRTPVAGMIHARHAAAHHAVLRPWAALIPMATLAAILVVVAYHMSEWRTFRGELRAPQSDVVVLLATFCLTVLVDLTVAIEVGMVLAAFLFMRRMAEVTNVSAMVGRRRRSGRSLLDRPQRRARAGRPAGRRGLRDQRAVLLRRRRDVQGDAGPGGGTAEGADHPHARRARDRLHRHARAARRRAAVAAAMARSCSCPTCTRSRSSR